jgi:polysaccharide pyruvyl transferase CsaB
MKVIHLIGGGDVGGAKVHVLSLVNELRKHIDVKIISLRHGSFADDARSMGIDIEVVKSSNIISDIRRVVEITNKGGYQIIHSHGSKANMFALIAKRFAKVPAVTTVHSDYRLDYMHNVLKRFSFGSINKIALRFMDYYIGVSDNFRKMLIERGFDPDDIFTVYNGMNFQDLLKDYSRDEFSKKYNLNLDSEDIVVGILARLYPVKGIETLINAAKTALEYNPRLKFVIGGDGEDRKHLENKAASLGISGNVSFLGWIDDPYELMSSLDINVLTSISESFPYSILEGARFKKATVSSNVGGIPDLISNGKNGYLFEPGDSEALSRYILELAGDKRKRDAMGENIYETASRKFSLESMCRSQLSIYASILEKEGRKRRKGRLLCNVIISGYYGFGNVGDDAMLMAIIDDLNMYGKDMDILVLSRNPAETMKTYGVDSIKRTNLFYIFKAMRNAALFIYGGGNIIQDNTSSRSLIYYLLTIWMAKHMGLKVMFYANGIGPLNKNVNKRLTRNIMNRVDVITLREELSLHELKRLQIDRPRIVLTADPALNIGKITEEEVNQIFEREGIDPDGPYIGISVRQWAGRDKYIDAVARTADHMMDRHGAKPIFIPMHHPGDLSVTESVLGRMRGKGYVLAGKYSASQILGVIGRTEMLVGMRLHALIFAASLGIPIVGLVYEPKIEGFLKYINQVSAGDVSRLDCDHLKSLVEEVWNDREKIRAKLSLDILALKQKAYENARIAVDLITSGERREL